MKKFLVATSLLLGIFLFNNVAFAEKLVILYTGQTHANLYPCHCPVEPFGGVSRRATIIRELRKQYANSLLLDSGDFFAGGSMDETNQPSASQKNRTKLYLQTLKIMGYDALNIGTDEFNFGDEFLAAQIKESKIPFLSCNLKVKGAQEFIIKEINKVKIGIIGIGILTVNPPLSFPIIETEAAVQQTVNKLKAKKVDLVILLSQLGEEPNSQLIKNVKGIDIVISGGVLSKSDKFTKIDNTILLRPVWQARKLGMLGIELKEKKIESFNVEQIPLGIDVPDDSEIKSLLPVCFSDYDCLKPNFIGICQNAGGKKASCAFEEIKKIPLLVIKPKNCITCNTDVAINNILRLLPNIEVGYSDLEQESSRKLIERLGITMLPAYILTNDIEKDRNFPNLKEVLDKKENYYLFKPYFTGISYFASRQFVKNQLDIFVLLRNKYTEQALKVIKALKDKMGNKINLKIHFLIIDEAQKGFLSQGGIPEIEDAKKAVCIMKYYPNRILDYLICRSSDIESSRQDKCFAPLKLDSEKIKGCALSAQADNLLRENIKLTQELPGFDTPIVLLNNQEIFHLNPETKAEELEKIIEGRLLNKEQRQ